MLSQSTSVNSDPWRACRRSLYSSALLLASIFMPGSSRALEVVALTPDAANSLAPGFGTTLEGALNDPFLYNPLNPTNPRPNQAGAAGPHGNSNPGGDIYFSYTFTNGAITLGAGQEFVVDVYGRDDGCCTLRDDNYDLELYSGGIGGTLVDSVTGLGILNDPPAHVRTSLGSVGQTFDSFRLVAHDADLADAQNYFLLQEIRAAIIDDAFTRLEIDRQTGAVTLLNNTGSNMNIVGYSFTSVAGAFNQSNWTTVTGNYDALPANGGTTGNGTVDVDDNWTVLSANSSVTDLSEGQLDVAGGNGGVLTAGQPVDLGTPWRSTPYEDVIAKVLLLDGSIETIPVIYNGTEIEVGNLDGVVGIGPADWAAFKAGQGTDFSELGLAASYLAGDLDGDGDHDLVDFGLFEEAYDLANGQGAFVDMLASANVPEPSSLAILGLGCLALVFRGRAIHKWKRTTIRAAIGSCVGFLAILAVATTSQAQTNVALGQPVIQSTTGFGLPATNAVDNNLNTISHTNTGDFFPYLEVDLGQFTSIETINVATRNNCCTPGSPERDYNILVEIRDAADSVVYSSPVLNPWDGVTNGAATTLGLGFVFEVDLIGNAVSGNKVRVSKTQGYTGSEWLSIAELQVFQEVPRLTLDVNTLDGNITLRNESSSLIEFDSYQIVSPGTTPTFIGSLNPGGWNNISERATPLAGFPQGNGEGDGWEAGPNVSDNELVEWYLDDELAPSSLASGGSINLGAAYNTAVNGQDLELYFRTTDGDVLEGFVKYDTMSGSDGDYNGDGVVNAADYVLGRDQIPGFYPDFLQNFTGMSGSGNAETGAAVPEPSFSALMLLAFGVLGLSIYSRRKGDLAMCGKRMTSRSCRPFISVASALIVAWAVVGSTAQAAVYNDRFYRLGDDPLEDAENAPGNIVGQGPSNVSPVDATLDSGESGDPTGTYLDLVPVGSPVYVDVSAVGSGRPWATTGELGVQFDGTATYLWGEQLDRPDALVERLQPEINYPINYTGITSRGVQMWAYVDSTKLALDQPQTLLMDSQIFGGPQITADGKWSQFNSQHSVDGSPAGGIPAEVEVVGNAWHHVMQHVYNANDPDAPVRLSGGGGTNHVAVLYVNGIAVSSNVDNLPIDGNLTANGFSGNLIVGAEDDGNGGFNNHFQGVLDDIKMYVFGNNETGFSGNLSDGEDWGTFDLFSDNDWIARTIVDTVPGGMLKDGDLNKDGNIDGSDIADFVDGWLSQNLQTGAHSTQTVGDWLTWESGDLNHDGITDLADLFIMNRALANAGAGTITADMLNGTSVPEPTSLALIGLGAAAVMWRRRRRKQYVRETRHESAARVF